MMQKIHVSVSEKKLQELLNGYIAPPSLGGRTGALEFLT
jgi:hypothetical protein